MKALDLAKPIQKTIAEAASVGEISDVFCFTVGFLSSELRFRLSNSPEESDKSELESQSRALEKAWEAYKEALL